MEGFAGKPYPSVQDLIEHGSGHTRQLGELVPGDRALPEQGYIGLGLVFRKPDPHQLVDRPVPVQHLDAHHVLLKMAVVIALT